MEEKYNTWAKWHSGRIEKKAYIYINLIYINLIYHILYFCIPLLAPQAATSSFNTVRPICHPMSHIASNGFRQQRLLAPNPSRRLLADFFFCLPLLLLLSRTLKYLPSFFPLPLCARLRPIPPPPFLSPTSSGGSAQTRRPLRVALHQRCAVPGAMAFPVRPMPAAPAARPR